MSNDTQIKCPNCGESIDVQDILSHQLEDEIKQKYEAQLAEQKQKFNKDFENLNKSKEEFELEKKSRMNCFRSVLISS